MRPIQTQAVVQNTPKEVLSTIVEELKTNLVQDFPSYIEQEDMDILKRISVKSDTSVVFDMVFSIKPTIRMMGYEEVFILDNTDVERYGINIQETELLTMEGKKLLIGINSECTTVYLVYRLEDAVWKK